MDTHLFLQRIVEKAQKIPLIFWMLLMVTFPVGAAAFGLFWLSETENSECRSVRNASTLSDSTRLYCAQTVAQRETPEALAEAIQFADTVAYDHPLRPDSDRLIRQWSGRLLEMGEGSFQAGRLDEALKLVQAIPTDTTVYETATTRTQEWKAIWEEAETIYDDAQSALDDNQILMALGEARKLVRVKNEYWNTTRFQELVNQIQATKDDKKTAGNTKKPDKQTPVSATALNTDDLMSQWQKEQDAEAAQHLSKAQQLATVGNVNGLKAAISEAELVFSGTAQYPQAQKLIADWNRQVEAIEDRPYLDRAMQLAQKGDLASLQAAISEANNIYFGRSLYREAQSKIDEWTNQARELHNQQYSQQLPANPQRAVQEADYQIPPAPPTP